MYGFVEEWVVNTIGRTTIDCDNYPLNGGGELFIVDVMVYDNIVKALKMIDAAIGEESATMSVRSNVEGMHVVMSSHFRNTGLFDAVTDGEIKAMDEYPRLINDTVVFDYTSMNILFEKAYEAVVNGIEFTVDLDDLTVTDTAGAATPAPAVEPVPEAAIAALGDPAVLESILDERFKSYLTERCGYRATNGIHISTLGMDLSMNSETDKALADLAKAMGYKIIVISDLNQSSFHIDTTPEIKQSMVDDYVNRNLLVIQDRIPGVTMHSHSKTGVSSVWGVDISSMNVSVPNNGGMSVFDYTFNDKVTNLSIAHMSKNILVLSIRLTALNSRNENNSKVVDILRGMALRAPGVEYNVMLGMDVDAHKREIDVNVETYSAMSIEDVMDTYKQIKKSYDESVKEADELQRKLMEVSRFAKKYSSDLMNFNASKAELDQRAKAVSEYYETMNIREVKTITSKENGSIDIFFDELYYTHITTGIIYDIGTFHISFNMLSKEYDPAKAMIIRNTKHIIKGYNDQMAAPHVFSNGAMCPGNIQSAIRSAYANRDLYQLTYALVMFLSEVNFLFW